MKTSYFENYRNYKDHPNIISISGKPPFGFKGKEYKKLAPKYWFFVKYKIDGNKENYTKAYNDEVLSKLNPKEVYMELGSNALLLCYESKGKFCHRHLVADWLNKNLNIKIEEL